MTAFVLCIPEGIRRLNSFYRHSGDGVEPYLAVPLDDPELLGTITPFRRPAQMSNWMSFRNIIRYAMKEDMPWVAVFEDDAVMSTPYEQLIPLIKQVPSGFDLFYLGGYFRQIRKEWSLSRVTDRIYRIKGEPLVWGKHAIVYGRHCYKELSEALVSDHYLSRNIIKKGNSYVLWPFAAVQMRDSGTNGRFDFESMEKQSDKCVRERTKA